MHAEVVSILSLMIALLSVVVGPLISLRIARKQNETQLLIAERNIRSAVHSRNRQEWINTLRSKIAEFISLTVTLRIQYGVKPEPKENIFESGRELFLLGTQIELMLNPAETDHAELSGFLDKVSKGLTELDNPQSEIAMLDAVGDMLPLAQRILKREWQRVKDLE